MNKIILFILFFLNINCLFASNSTEADFLVPNDGSCKDCVQSSKKKIISVEAEATELLNALTKPFECHGHINSNSCVLNRWLKWKYESYAPNCKPFFMDQNGNLGKFSQFTGNLFLRDFKKNGENSRFYQSNADFDKYCPNYKNFDVMTKAAFHGWIFELTAFPESSCNEKVKPNLNSPTTKAVCMFQLEDKAQFRYWRSKGMEIPSECKDKDYLKRHPLDCKSRCAISEKEILTFEGCTGCAFDEYSRKINNDETPFGQIDSKGNKTDGSYWASHNQLSASQIACIEKYAVIDKKTGKPTWPIGKNKKPNWLNGCKGANWEWMARYKFFNRIQRFPLCNTTASYKELADMMIFENTQPKK